MKYQRSAFTENLMAAMTSGLRQKGPSYQLPESLALEYGRLCYNQAVGDCIQYLYAMGKNSDHQLLTQDIADGLQLLHLKQEELHEKTR